MRKTLLLLAALAALTLLLAACDGDDEPDEPEVDDDEEVEDAPDDEEYSIEDQPDDAAARFVSPEDGDTVSAPVAVEMEAEGVELAPAGEPVVGEGHFHVMVDIGCVDEGEVIPGPGDAAEEEGHFHFGDGQDSGEIDLEPGEYELCVQLADGPHSAFGDTHTITVTVE